MWPFRRDSRRVRPGRALPGSAGLTLVEILVSMALAVILLGSIYYVYALSSASYRMAGQQLRAMDQARFAMEQIRRDVAAAAFMATPASTSDPNVCRKPSPPLHGIALQQVGDVANGGLGANDNQNISPTAVTLLGAWWNTGIYVVDHIDGLGTQVFLRTDSLPPRAEFDATFVPGRFLRVVTQDQFELYPIIAAADHGTGIVTLTPGTALPVAVPPDSCGYYGDGNGMEINVVGYVRYRIVRDSRAGAPAAKTDLVREEMDNRFQPVRGSMLVIAEHVIDLQFYDFVFDSDTSRRDPNLAVTPLVTGVVNGSTGILGTNDDATPQRLRYLTAKVTTRTEEEDQGLRFAPRQNLFAPIDSYQVDPIMEGAARTASLATRIGLRSFAVRNVL